MNMKKKIHIMVVALIAIVACSYADTSSFLTVTYVTEDGQKSDKFSIEGGEIQILDNAVDVVFTGNPDQNKSYIFDEISSLQFETQTVNRNTNPVMQFKVFTDMGAGVLYLRAEEPMGLINIYSVAGTLVRSVNFNNTEIEINIRDISPGVYMVKKGNQIVKFVK